MDVETLAENLTELQALSRRPSGLSTGQKMTVARIRGQIPAPTLAHFDRLLAQGRKGIAEVRNGVCSGCYLKLPTSMTGALTDELATCENCGAFLSFAREEAAVGMAMASR